jgi:hypothetical protein
MPHDVEVQPGSPSKNAENQDAATLTQSQPSTTEEIEARASHDADVGDGASGVPVQIGPVPEEGRR